MNMPLVLLNRRRRGGPAAFSPTRLFALAEPGVWYDPSDVANLNWRRNLLTWTEQFDNAAWTKSGATVSANAAAAPDGATTADKLVENTANTNHRATQDFTVTSGLDYTFTVYAKSVERSRITLLLVLAGSFRVQTFNLSSGTVQASASSGAALTNPVATIADAGNGWFRCSLKVTTASSGVMNTGFDINNSDASSSAYLGDGTSGILIWGAQLELGSTATDYQKITDVNTEVIERFPTATLYQDTAGTQPVTTPGQTVALALDKSKGLVLGPELVTNGDFSGGTTGWAVSAQSSISGGQARVVSTDGSFQNIAQNRTLNGPSWYEVSLDVVSVASGSLNFAFTGAGVNVSIPAGAGRRVVRFFVASNTSSSLSFGRSAGVTDITVDNISVRELPGFHATQATAASRPTYGIVPRTGRRNLLTRTEEFNDAVWVKGNSSVATNVATAPNGTMTADKFVENTALTDHYINSASNAVTTATAYTFTCYAKAAERTVLAVYMSGVTATGVTSFNLSTGAVIATSVNAVSSITDAGNGWYRCSVRVTTNATASVVYLYPNTGGTAYQGDGTSGIFIWGAQLETGSSATAYQRVGSAFDVTEAGVASLSYLSFDGVDDFLVTPTITPGVDKAQVFAGVRKIGTGASTFVETSADSGTQNGSFGLFAPSGFGNDYFLSSRGSVTQSITTGANTFVAPITNVLTGLCDISGDRATLRVNGTQVAQSTADQGTGNFLAYPIYIGRRGGTTLSFNGNLFSLIVRFGTNLDAGTITSTETWVAGKTGVTL